jgi:cyclopropane-fatty-acyl-phospholipid synthase
LTHGRLEIDSGGTRHAFGTRRTGELHAHVTVHDERFYRRVVLGGTLGAAESYMDGEWSTPDLTSVVRLLLRNELVMLGIESGMARLGASFTRAFSALPRNTREGSRKNIASHYDLGNDFFQRMLDPTMTYSSGVFASESSTLEQASRNKLDLLCQKLELSVGERLLEIGTGWGSLALHAAEHYGCDVTTTTISREQHRLASERVRKAGLDDVVHVLENDYRDLEGRFDKLVSVEMIEAVGSEYYDTFFGKCSALLVPGGRMALQSITIRDQAYEQHRVETDFIKRYVFPGSTIPSVTALAESATRASDLRLSDLRDYGPHYARTLSEWRKNLEPHRAWVVARYGERFYRLWMFYLAYCEAGFSERYISLVQMVFERPKWKAS